MTKYDVTVYDVTKYDVITPFRPPLLVTIFVDVCPPLLVTIFVDVCPPLLVTIFVDVRPQDNVLPLSQMYILRCELKFGVCGCSSHH